MKKGVKRAGSFIIICFHYIMESCDSFETVKKLVLERRSVRKYLDKEIPAEELKEVLELAQVGLIFVFLMSRELLPQ